MIKNLINKILGKPKEKQGEISFQAGYDLTDLPIVTLKQGDRKLNFLLDTGATDSLIDANVLKTLEHSPTDMCTEVMDINGHRKTANYYVVTLSFKDRDYTFVYASMNMTSAFGDVKKNTGVTVHGIIGSKFFNKFKYILDFDELIAYSKK